MTEQDFLIRLRNCTQIPWEMTDKLQDKSFDSLDTMHNIQCIEDEFNVRLPISTHDWSIQEIYKMVTE
jgi:acyl carrier protein